MIINHDIKMASYQPCNHVPAALYGETCSYLLELPAVPPEPPWVS